MFRIKIKKLLVPAKLNPPVTQTEPRRHLLTIQDHRKKKTKINTGSEKAPI